MRPTQFFSDEALEGGRRMKAVEVLRFLEDFRRIHAPGARSVLISLKVPEPLLRAFRLACESEGVRYQTRIKELMAAALGRRQP